MMSPFEFIGHAGNRGRIVWFVFVEQNGDEIEYIGLRPFRPCVKTIGKRILRRFKIWKPY